MASQPLPNGACSTGYTDFIAMCENTAPNRQTQIISGSANSCCTNFTKHPGIPVHVPAEVLGMDIDDVTTRVDPDGVSSLKPDQHNFPMPLGPIQETHHVNSDMFAHIEASASVGSNGVLNCGERCSESGSILADALGEALPSIIDDTGCTQAALGRVFEVDIVARAIQLLGVDQAQLLVHLLKSSSEFLMKNGKRRKGKGGRRPAADPRVDPTIDPKKAKRIVANRKSAAKSKEKQKKEAANLKIRHDRKLCQLRAMAFEVRFLEECISNMEKENISLDSRVEALCSRCSDADMMIVNLSSNKDELVSQQASTQATRQECRADPAPGMPCIGGLPLDCTQSMTKTSTTASPMIIEPPIASAPPQCPFDAPTPVMSLEDCNSRDFLWDFGLLSHDMDMMDWREW